VAGLTIIDLVPDTSSHRAPKTSKKRSSKKSDPPKK
jgi:hypothetical protein